MRTSISQFVVAGLLFGAVPYAAALDGQPVILTSERVVQTLRSSGFNAHAGEVEFVSSVPVSTSVPKLRVENWKRLSDSTAWVQLRCERSGDCIPFFVILHGTENGFPGKPERKNEVRTPALLRADRTLLVRVGMRATLFLQSASSLITTVVVCLDNGALGTQVRVKNPVTKQVLMAEVIDKGVVKSKF